MCHLLKEGLRCLGGAGKPQPSSFAGAFAFEVKGRLSRAKPCGGAGCPGAGGCAGFGGRPISPPCRVHLAEGRENRASSLAPFLRRDCARARRQANQKFPPGLDCVRRRRLLAGRPPSRPARVLGEPTSVQPPTRGRALER